VLLHAARLHVVHHVVVATLAAIQVATAVVVDADKLHQLVADVEQQ